MDSSVERWEFSCFGRTKEAWGGGVQAPFFHNPTSSLPPSLLPSLERCLLSRSCDSVQSVPPSRRISCCESGRSAPRRADTEPRPFISKTPVAAATPATRDDAPVGPETITQHRSVCLRPVTCGESAATSER